LNLQTKRLQLRPVSLDDGAFIFDLMNTPQWLENIGDRDLKKVEDAVEYIKVKMIPQQEEYGYGNFLMQLSKTNEKIGTIGLYRRPGVEGVDLGFALLPQYFRKGYTYEASKEIINLALNTLKLHPLNAITSLTNVASQNLILKLGFEFKGKRKITDIETEQLFYQYPTTSGF